MAALCGTGTRELGLVKDLLDSTDCHVRALTEIAYGALSGPDSEFPLILTVLMTIAVALFGLRLLLGFSPLKVGDLTLTAIKFGIVLALATSWPLYQQLVLEVLFHGPEQLGSSLLAALHSSGIGGRHNPFGGLQQAYDQMQAAAALFRQAPAGGATVSPESLSAAMSMTISAWVLLFANLGLVLVAKIILGLLTGLGPLFAGLLLFESTRGMFEGWLRAMLVFSLLPLVISLALVLQLVLLEPHLNALANLLPGEPPKVTDATSILMLSIVSAVVAVMAAGATLLIAMGLRLKGAKPNVTESAASPLKTATLSEPLRDLSIDRRITAIGTAALQRDRRGARHVAGALSLALAPPELAGPNEGIVTTQMPYRAQARPRRTGGSARRDS